MQGDVATCAHPIRGETNAELETEGRADPASDEEVGKAMLIPADAEDVADVLVHELPVMAVDWLWREYGVPPQGPPLCRGDAFHHDLWPEAPCLLSPQMAFSEVMTEHTWRPP